VVRDLYRNDGGVSYPYPIGTVGSITGSTGGSTFYYYLYDWVVYTDPVVATSARTMVTATVTNGVQLTVKMKLEGPYVSGTGLMDDGLRVAGIVPLNEPYTALGLVQAAGGGGETMAASMLTPSGNDAIIDWVRVELRSSADPASIVATKQCLLQRDGDVVTTTGGSTLTFGVVPGNYYVAVRHRNHLGCMTASALALSTSPVLVDMTLAGTSTWGTQARKDISGTQVLWTGNAVFDAELRYTGSSNDRDAILLAIGGVVPTATTTGYSLTDCTMDGVTKYTGSANDRDPILQNIGGVIPTNVRAQQLP
jgi:hypothetical protein